MRDLYGMLWYHMGWLDQDLNPVPSESGKRLRPTLLLLTVEAMGGNWQRALPAAASLELLHNFSLIHDDIEDASEERRHRPSLWRLWGVPMALNAGDLLFGISRRALLDLRRNGYGSDILLAAIELLDDAVLELCEGQHRDLAFESQTQVELQEYMEMISGKTASLMGCCTEMAALLAGHPSHRRISREFGFQLGMAFQMQDDILGIWGIRAHTGKPSESDILQRKKSLPIVLAMHAARPPDALRLRQIYSKPLTADEYMTVMELLEEYQIKNRAEAMAQERLQNALETLAALPVTEEGKAELEALARYAVYRES
jgi:geranylgeranyl diphosphate synthase type I